MKDIKKLNSALNDIDERLHAIEAERRSSQATTEVRIKEHSRLKGDTQAQ